MMKKIFVFAAVLALARAAVVESPEPEASAEASAAPVCFPGSAHVSLENGEVKRMDSVQVGDRVKVANGEFANVFMFTHKMADAKFNFLRLNTVSGEAITLTPSHVLPVNGEYVAARDAKVGDSLELADGTISQINGIATVEEFGLFNPQTVHGDIVVDGVRASTYTSDVCPSFAHALLTPLRMAYERVGLTTALLNKGSDLLASLAPKM